jgi:hypothetical protein
MLLKKGAFNFPSGSVRERPHIHYGKAQTEAQIELKPGKHTLQDVFADKNHIPHEPPVQSDPITITVE